MNYQKIYNNLIDRANSRLVEDYVEKHHIIPRCLGGTDSKENIVNLYPEEHYLAHLLLCKLNKGNSKLLYAAMNMTSGAMINNGKRNNKAYGWLRRQYAESMSGDNNPARRIPNLQKEAAKKRVGQKRSEETKIKMSQAQKGRTVSDETKLKMAEAAKKRPPISDETRQKLKQRTPNKGMLGRTMSEETRAKMSASQQGKKMSEEAKAKMRIAAKIREAKKREKILY
jgi:NUMOD3 motif